MKDTPIKADKMASIVGKNKVVILSVAVAIVGSVLFYFHSNEKAFHRHTGTGAPISFTPDTECTIATIGHFYSILDDPAIQSQLISQINSENADAVILTGDLTLDGSKDQEWEIVRNFMKAINADVYGVPGNHDLINKKARANWLKNIGYISKKVAVKKCNLILLDSVNSVDLNYDWHKMIVGGGLDKEGVDILKTLENGINLMFMHHTLYDSDVTIMDSDLRNKEHHIYKNSLVQEDVWEKNIYPLIKGKVQCVYSGDWHSRRTSVKSQGTTTYLANGFARKGNNLSYTISYVKNENDILHYIRSVRVPRSSNWFE